MKRMGSWPTGTHERRLVGVSHCANAAVGRVGKMS